MSNHEGKQVGIYRLYKLGRMSDKSFDKDIKKIDRDLHPVHHSFAENSNDHYKMNGLWYEEDKEATKKYWNKQPYDTPKEYVKFEEIPPADEDQEDKDENDGSDDNGNSEIAEIKNKLSEMNKEQLIEFAEKNDYKVTRTKKAENILIELIEQIEVVE